MFNLLQVHEKILRNFRELQCRKISYKISSGISSKSPEKRVWVDSELFMLEELICKLENFVELILKKNFVSKHSVLRPGRSFASVFYIEMEEWLRGVSSTWLIGGL